KRAKALCPCCNLVMSPERVRFQLVPQKGGADVVFDAKGKRTGGGRLLCVVVSTPNSSGKKYRLPESKDYEAVHESQKAIQKLCAEKSDISPVPDEPIPL